MFLTYATFCRNQQKSRQLGLILRQIDYFGSESKESGHQILKNKRQSLVTHNLHRLSCGARRHLLVPQEDMYCGARRHGLLWHNEACPTKNCKKSDKSGLYLGKSTTLGMTRKNPTAKYFKIGAKVELRGFPSPRRSGRSPLGYVVCPRPRPATSKKTKAVKVLQ